MIAVFKKFPKKALTNFILTPYTISNNNNSSQKCLYLYHTKIKLSEIRIIEILSFIFTDKR